MPSRLPRSSTPSQILSVSWLVQKETRGFLNPHVGFQRDKTNVAEP